MSQIMQGNALKLLFAGLLFGLLAKLQLQGLCTDSRLGALLTLRSVIRMEVRKMLQVMNGARFRGLSGCIVCFHSSCRLHETLEPGGDLGTNCIGG